MGNAVFHVSSPAAALRDVFAAPLDVTPLLSMLCDDRSRVLGDFGIVAPLVCVVLCCVVCARVCGGGAFFLSRVLRRKHI